VKRSPKEILVPYGNWLIAKPGDYLTASNINDSWSSNECYGLGNASEINLGFKAVRLAAIGIAFHGYWQASNQLLVSQAPCNIVTKQDKSCAGS